jgi:hypothetical protein
MRLNGQHLGAHHCIDVCEAVRVEQGLDVFAEEALVGSEQVEHVRERVFGLQHRDSTQPGFFDQSLEAKPHTLSILFVFLSPSKCHLNLSSSGCTRGTIASTGRVASSTSSWPGSGFVSRLQAETSQLCRMRYAKTERATYSCSSARRSRKAILNSIFAG